MAGQGSLREFTDRLRAAAASPPASRLAARSLFAHVRQHAGFDARAALSWCLSCPTPAVVAEATDAVDWLLASGRLAAPVVIADVLAAMSSPGAGGGPGAAQCTTHLVTCLVGLVTRGDSQAATPGDVDTHPLAVALRLAPQAASQALVVGLSRALDSDDSGGTHTKALAPFLKYGLLCSPSTAGAFPGLLRQTLARTALAKSGDAASHARRCALASLLCDTLPLAHRSDTLDCAAEAAVAAADAADVVEALCWEQGPGSPAAWSQPLAALLAQACVHLMYDATQVGASLAPLASALARSAGCCEGGEVLSPHAAALAGLACRATPGDVACLIPLLRAVAPRASPATSALCAVALLPALSLPHGRHSPHLAALVRRFERGAACQDMRSDQGSAMSAAAGDAAVFGVVDTALREGWKDDHACLVWLQAMRERVAAKAGMHLWFQPGGPAGAVGGTAGLAGAACLWHPSGDVVAAAAHLVGAILARTALHSAPALVPALLRRLAWAGSTKRVAVLHTLLAIPHAAAHASGSAAALRALARLTDATAAPRQGVPQSPALVPLALRTLAAVAATHTQCTPRLVAAVSDAATSASQGSVHAVKLAAASAVFASCVRDPSGAGLALLMPLQALLDARWPDAAALALDALGELCGADVIDFYTALRYVQGPQRRGSSATGHASAVAPPHAHDCLAAAWARFAAHGAMDAAARPAEAGPLLAHLWGLASGQAAPGVRLAAWTSLAAYGDQGWAPLAGMTPDGVACRALEDVDKGVTAAAEPVLTALVAAETAELPRGAAGGVASASRAASKTARLPRDDGPMYRLQTVVPKLLRRGLQPAGADAGGGAGPGALLMCWHNGSDGEAPPSHTGRGKAAAAAAAAAAGSDAYTHAAHEAAAFLRTRGSSAPPRLAHMASAMHAWALFLRRWCSAAALAARSGSDATLSASGAASAGARAVLDQLVALLKGPDSAAADNAALALGVLPASVSDITAGDTAALAALCCAALQRVLSPSHPHTDPTALDLAAPLSRAMAASVGLGAAAACLPTSEADVTTQCVELLRTRLQQGSLAAREGDARSDSGEGDAFGAGHTSALLAASAACGLGVFVARSDLVQGSKHSTAAKLCGAALGALCATMAQCMPDDAARQAAAALAASLAERDVVISPVTATSLQPVSQGGTSPRLASMVACGACAGVATACDVIGRLAGGSALPALLQALLRPAVLDDRILGGAAATSLPAVLTACLKWASLKEADALGCVDALVQRAASVSTAAALTVGLSDTRPAAACIAAGGALHAVMATGVRVPTSSVQAFLEAAAACGAPSAPSLLRVSAACGCANLLGAAAHLYGAAPVTATASSLGIDGNTLATPLLTAGPAGASLARAALKQMEALVAGDSDAHVRQAAAWALAQASAAGSAIHAALVAASASASSLGGTLDGLPAESATRVVCIRILDGPAAQQSTRSLALALRVLAAAPRLPSGPPWGAVMARLMREHGDVAADVCRLAVAHAQRVPSLASFLDDILAPPRLRDLAPHTRAAVFSSAACVHALGAVAEATACAALTEAASLAVAAGAAADETHALWKATCAVLAGPAGRLRDAAAAAALLLLQHSTPGDLPPAALDTLRGCPRGETRAMLHACAATAPAVATALCVALVRTSHLGWGDLTAAQATLMHGRGVSRGALLHQVAHTLCQAQAPVREQWLRSTLEAASRGDLFPLAVLASEWHPPTHALCMPTVPWPRGWYGEGKCAPAQALPCALSPVVQPLGLAPTAAEALLGACTRGDGAQTARTCLASMKHSLDGDVSREPDADAGEGSGRLLYAAIAPQLGD